MWCEESGQRVGGGRGEGVSKTRQNNAINLKFVTQVHIYEVSENLPFITRDLLILLMSAVFSKTQHFLVKNSSFTQSNSVRAVLENLQFCFQFLQDKKLLLQKMLVFQSMRPESSFRIAPSWPSFRKMTIGILGKESYVITQKNKKRKKPNKKIPRSHGNATSLHILKRFVFLSAYFPINLIKVLQLPISMKKILILMF